MTGPSDEPPVLILCDWAEAINGKLYMQGAGFNQIVANQPIPLAIAVLWQVPWHQTNTPHDLTFRLMTADGEPVSDAVGNALVIQGKIEAGRPPGAKHGDSFPIPIAIKLPPFPLAQGDYRWELEINGKSAAHASFRAVPQIGVPG